MYSVPNSAHVALLLFAFFLVVCTRWITESEQSIGERTVFAVFFSKVEVYESCNNNSDKNENSNLNLTIVPLRLQKKKVFGVHSFDDM